MTSKIKFFARLLVITLFSTFISCNEELYNIKDQHNGVDKNKISVAQFKNETNIGKVEIILSVPSKTSIASKSKSQVSDFVIDTLAIKRHISTDNKTTYTFRIYPLHAVAQQNEIYNLVYRKMNNKWETYIFYLKKLPQEDSEHKIFEKIERIQGGKIINALTSKSSSTGDCSYETFSVHCDGSCAREGYSQCDGFACPTGQCLRRSITYLSCELGGGGGGTYDPSGSTGGGGGGDTSNPSNTSGSSTLEPFIYSPNEIDNPTYNDPNYINEINKSFIWANLGDAAQRFFESDLQHLNYFNETIQYQIDNNWSNETYDYSNWARNYKFEHPEITFAQFQNWFMGSSEGVDGDYDADFWENPNLTFPAQSLPSFNDFKNACPSKYTNAETLCNDIGGDVSDIYNNVVARGLKLNTCAISISKAFQGSGIVIPALPNNPNGTKNTVKDKNGNNIIINAKALNQRMRKTFGTNPSNYIHYTAAQGGDKGSGFPKLMENKQGIYTMVSRPEIQKTWGTGHADLLENGECRQKCHFYDEKNQFVPVDYVDIWLLN